MQKKDETLRREKVIIAASNAIFVISWLALCVHLIRRWNMIGRPLRFDAISMLMLFGILWFTLRREKASYWCLVAASFAFSTLLTIVPRAF